MQRVPVSSSHIISIGYDRESRLLEIEYKDGNVYQYLDVPIEENEALMQAESHGRYINNHIRNRYKYSRIT
ncbi:MAG: KTSC domain-containing protein [Ignavibacteriales bacterium]|nr:KTSC domain-containing protein [Ignavibacteriales bacterium]